MANSSLTLSSLDFDTLKENYKEYLKTQSVFKDYNFDGSNINVLLDVMSYNTYLNSFYLNMIASEMFLDSAQKYESVLSHAKELNYIPRSSHAASADISFSLDTNIEGKITIPKGTRFYGRNSIGSFNFVTTESHVYKSGNTTYEVANLQISQGTYFQDSFVMDYDIENQRFILSNQNIDTDTIYVTVSENDNVTNTVFNFAVNLFGVDNTSNVFFLQAIANNKYEISFGDGYFGRKPLNTSLINVDYIVTNGSDGNDVESFSLSDDLGVYNNGTADISTITVNRVSQTGSNQQSIESVRFEAPRYFATQQRAISSDDYSSLIRSEFGGEISDVIVYGGETVEPKKYGRVIISIKPSTGTIAPDYIKNKIKKYMLDYIALPNRIEITDPDYLYVRVDTAVQYDLTQTKKPASDIKSIVADAIKNYSVDNLERFGNDLRYSRLVATIDNSDTSITSNQTDFRVIKRLTPKLGYPTSYDINIGNMIYIEGAPVANVDHIALHGSDFNLHYAHAALISSRFTYNSTDGNTYEQCYIEDDSLGNVNVYAPVSNTILKVDTVGTIQYIKGTVSLKNLNVASYENHISLYFRTVYRDIFATPDKIIVIDSGDVTVTVTEKQN